MECINYSDFLDTCQTGDLVLYNSTAIYSRIIEVLSGSKYSHISFILKNPTWLHSDLSGIYVFESGLEPSKDILSGDKVFGVQLTSMDLIKEEYINAKCGYIYHVKNDFERTQEYYDKLKDLIINTDKTKYDLNPIDWLKAKFNINIGKRIVNRFFCSALVAYLMENLNQIEKNIDWSYIAPYRFSKNSKDCLNFINCNVNNEKYIRF
jgi:hypothetical protein